MKSKAYIRLQKETIKRERKFVLREHLKAAGGLTALLIVLVFMACGQAHPSTWKETTVAMFDCELEVIPRMELTLNTTKGLFTVYKNEDALQQTLKFGQSYTLTYAENWLNNTVTAITVDGVEYINYDESVNEYYYTEIAYWSAITVTAVVCGIVNAVVYRKKTKESIRTIRTCRKNLRDGKQTTKG